MSDHCALTWTQPAIQGVGLRDPRLRRRFDIVFSAMAANPESSVCGRHGSWAQTAGALRLLHNERCTPEALQQGAIAATRQVLATLAERPDAGVPGAGVPGVPGVTLMVHDQTEFKPVFKMSPSKLMQHTALAVEARANGAVHGLMHQRWFDDPKAPQGEKRDQRRERWTRSQAWPEAVAAVGQPAPGGRWIHVADREADDFQMFAACDQPGHGFVIRSQHDRYLTDGSKLRQTLADRPVVGEVTVHVGRRSKVGVKAPPMARRPAQGARIAHCEVRYATVTLAPPRNDPRYSQPRQAWAVSVREINPPANKSIAPVDWLLLTSEPVTNLDQALTVIGWYRRRWVIEEFHRSQKTGCKLERSQLQSPQAFIRLAAMAGMIAVRLLDLRELADDERTRDQPASRHIDDWLWVRVVAHLAKVDPRTLTVQQFYHTIARQGGWNGRKSDGRPGWQTLWRGWRHVQTLVEGAYLAQALNDDPKRCV